MIPDADGLVRAWLRDQSEVIALTGTRQYFTMPEKDRPMLPCIVLIRVGGEPIDEIDYPRMSFGCWGKDKKEASNLGYVLASVLDRATRGMPFRSDVGTVMCVYDVVSPIPMKGVDWAKAVRVQASFMTQAT